MVEKLEATSREGLFGRLIDIIGPERDSWIGRRLVEFGVARPIVPAMDGILFEEHEKILQIYCHGLMGDHFSLRPARRKDVSPYTDTRTVYLPASVGEFEDPEHNFRLLKLMLVHQLAQIEHGSFELGSQLATFEDPALGEYLYALVEWTRVERLIRSKYPGTARDLDHSQQDALAKRPRIERMSQRTAAVEALVRWSLGGEIPPTLPKKAAEIVEGCIEVLEETLAGDARPADSIRVAMYVYNRVQALSGPFQPLQTVHFRGQMRLDLAGSILLERKRQQFLTIDPETVEIEHFDNERGVLKTKMADDVNMSPTKVVVREHVRAEGVGGQESDEHTLWLDIAGKRASVEQELTATEREGAFIYDEWDYERLAYRPRWCALRERVVRQGSPDYVDSVLQKHRTLVSHIKRQFDTLRPEYRRLRKQPDGEDIDLDSLVEAYADLRAGSTPNDNLYLARQANRRDIGVAFLVDLSGSAGGWIGESRIIDTEREALVLICEALQMLNDRYAVFGFSSSTRKQCDLYVVKDFGESYGNEVKLRIGGLDTYSYTRMGPPIRHISRRLDTLDARVKLLFILTDGKPNDFDGYSGRYALEDTRQALAEAKVRGIKTYCLTIDSRARDYLPQVFGADGYSIIDNVEKLPSKLPDLYRRLTSR